MNNTQKMLGFLEEGVQIRNWNSVIEIVECFKNGTAHVIEANWADNFKQKNPSLYPLNLEKIDTWSTYEDCVFLQFELIKNKLTCKAEIFDGNMHGYPRELRFTAKFNLPISFLSKIKDSIEWRFDRFLEQSYEEYLETEKRIWINTTKANLLK